MTSTLVPAVLGALPIVVPCGVGVVMCLTLLSRARTNAICGALGFALAGGVAMLASILPVLLNAWAEQQHRSYSTLSPIYSGMYFVWAVLRGISFVLLIVAIVAGRKDARTTLSNQA